MISSENQQGKQMKGEVPSILGKERPMSPLATKFHLPPHQKQ
jgi:hypothetical protein